MVELFATAQVETRRQAAYKSRHRTPATLTAPPLGGFGTGSSRASASRGVGTIPAHAPPQSTLCRSFAAGINQPHVLPNIVTSVFESNITAAQCYAAYGRAPPGVSVDMFSAPSLSEGHGGAGAGLAGRHSHARVQYSNAADAAIALGGHDLFGSSAHVAGSSLANDINDVDFGLAACLATPMDPGSGFERRLAELPATTTAARSAANKLVSGDDVLQEAGRTGELVRRLRRRRRRLAAAQAALGARGAAAAKARPAGPKPDNAQEGEQLRDPPTAHGGSPGSSQQGRQAAIGTTNWAGSNAAADEVSSTARKRLSDGNVQLVAVDPVAAAAAACAVFEAERRQEEELLLAGDLTTGSDEDVESHDVYDSSDEVVLQAHNAELLEALET